MADTGDIEAYLEQQVEQQVRLLTWKEGVKGGMVMMTKNDMGRRKKLTWVPENCIQLM